MEWVTEKEEWLVDWSDARCLKELVFEAPTASDAVDSSQSSDSDPDVFFSDVIQAAEKCLVCRASGAVVDIFDVSPTVSSLTSWRVQLPSSVVRDVGISHICCAGNTSLYLFFLTRASTIHRVQLSLSTGVPDVVRSGSTVCTLSSPPATFCAMDAHFAAVGCFDGTLHAFGLVGGSQHSQLGLPEYQFSDGSWLRKFYSATRSAPRVLALASLGIDVGSGAGIRLLSFSADGKLRLWQAFERNCRLVSSVDVLASLDAILRVGSSFTRACLVTRNSVYLIELPTQSVSESLVVREIQPPFASAVPLIVTLSHETVWSFWSGCGREQLFSLSLDAPDAEAWKANVLGANPVHNASASSQNIINVICEGTEAMAAAMGRHHVVFTLYQQQEVWRREEDDFTVLRFMDMYHEREQQSSEAGMVDVSTSWNESFDRDASVEDLVLRWWLQRIFIPGRFSKSVLSQAVDEASRGISSPSLLQRSSKSIHQVVEDLLVSCANAATAGTSNPVMQKAEKLAEVAQAFLLECDKVWKRKHQVCCLGASALWAQHVGNMSSAVPMLLCLGGVSCIRPVQNWSERWWSSLHLCKDLSNYQTSLDIESVINSSRMDEWKLCTTAYLLSQAVGKANLGLSLGMLRRSASPSSLMSHFVDDVPSNVVQRCFLNIGDRSSLVALLDIIGGAVEATYTDKPRGNSSMDIDGSAELQLSDVLRGGVVASECEYVNSSIRDLLLLTTYALRTNTLPGSNANPQDWRAWQISLDRYLQKSSSLLCCIRQELPRLAGSGRETIDEHLRGCDLWATHLRAYEKLLRVPPASFGKLEFAFQLIQREAWDALRLWNRHQSSKAIMVYLAGRDFLAGGRFDVASEAFLHAHSLGVAVMLPKFQGLGLPQESSPPGIAFWVHVSQCFAACGSMAHAYSFMCKASEDAEKQDSSRPLRQHLWSEAFRIAIDLEYLTEAIEKILPKIENYEHALDDLGQKLRSIGKVDLMLKLPPEHRAYIVNSLRSYALRTTPTPRSDSLSCYQLLYALHFSLQEYVEAAAVAYNLYSALASSLEQRVLADVGSLHSHNVSSTSNLSKENDVPRSSALLSLGSNARGKDTNMGISTFAEVWPVLEQQRNTLLMFISATSLTPDKLVVLPSQHAASGMQIDCTFTSTSSHNFDDMEAWFAQSDCIAKGCVITLNEAEGLLATAEAYMALCGHGQKELVSPSVAARKIARLGLLGLALQIARARDLDLWQCVFKPFTQFCMDADGCEDARTWSSKHICRGEAQAYMFMNSDSYDPMDVDGSVSKGLWRTLEEGLRSCNSERASSLSCLFLMVAEEILSHRPDARLPEFLLQNLSGLSIDALLGLYIRHSRMGDSIDLLNQELSQCETWLQSADLKACSPLQDFPVRRLVQLRNGLRDHIVKSEIDCNTWIPSLEKALMHLESLLVDCERC